MHRYAPRFLAGGSLLLLAGITSGISQPRPPLPPPAVRVKFAIDAGVKYLKAQEAGRGHWEVNLASTVESGGWTALALLALLEAEVPPADPVVARGLDWLRGQKPTGTYAVTLQTLVFARLGDPRDRPILERNVRWLLDARSRFDDRLVGWGYGARPRGTADQSNTLFAVLGLHAAARAGVAVDGKDWEQIRELYRKTQQKDGGWGYSAVVPESTLTMTSAGIAGLSLAAESAGPGWQQLRSDGTSAACEGFPDRETLGRAARWLEEPQRFTPTSAAKYLFYQLAEVEQLGRLTGRKYVGGQDWYRIGSDELVRSQSEDGSWQITARGADGLPILSTSFALLFLARGRAPVLLTQLAWGRADGWGPKPHAAMHVVAAARKELFPATGPLAWQVLDVRGRDLSSDETVQREWADLRHSPVLYMTGHERPKLTPGQKQLLRFYLYDGGLLFAESCCGSDEFTTGFRELMHDLFPDSPLRPLPDRHPVRHTPHLLPAAAVNLQGIEYGCRTAVVFSPRPLGGWWEEGKRDEGHGREAFDLAVNVTAYATGGHRPPPRLTGDEDEAVTGRPTPRSYLRLAQIIPAANPLLPSRALRPLAAHLRKDMSLDVNLDVSSLRPGDPDLPEYKFLYLSAREALALSKEEQEVLQFSLQTGGLLFADSCGGRAEFDTAFRALAAKLFPKRPLEPIPTTDPLFDKKVIGESLAEVRYHRAEDKPGAFTPGPPQLEGIKIDGRWVVVYSQYGVGCPLAGKAGPEAADYDAESALRIVRAAVVYSLKR